MKQFGEVFLFQTLFMGERKGPPSPTRDHRMLLDALDERSFEGAYGGNL